VRTRLNQSIQESFGYFMLEVEDNGVGILPSEINKLFTPFFKTIDKESRSMNTKGHGLGLYISRKIARILGGDITV
jgi:signal transduction histidine kinase